MMNLSTEFNNAAQGGPENSSGAEGPEPHGPTTPSSAVHADRSDTGLSPEFTAAVAATPLQIPWVDIDQDEDGSTLEAVEAELEMLKAGRAELTPEYEFKAPRAIAKCSLMLTEGKREARILALEAFREAARHDFDNQNRQDLEEGLELSL